MRDSDKCGFEERTATKNFSGSGTCGNVRETSALRKKCVDFVSQFIDEQVTLLIRVAELHISHRYRRHRDHFWHGKPREAWTELERDGQDLDLSWV